MSSVILSTWVITLSTLSRYLPKDENKVLEVLNVATCYNDNCAGTGNTHTISFSNKVQTLPCVFIIQSHPYLFVKSYQL